MFKIESGLEVPKKVGTSGRPAIYPFGELLVGQSFLVPKGKASVSARNSAVSYARRNGVKFTSRSVEGGVRIWRVE